MYILYFTVPESHLESVKNAIFSTGAGSMENYSHCAWQTLGQGQFVPLEGSDAFLGNINKLEYVPEYKVELLCTEETISSAVQALKAAHPYEVPYFQVVRCETNF